MSLIIRARVGSLGALVVGALVLSACGTSAASDPGAEGATRVVTSTDVYGSIARAIAGDHVPVTSIIANPSVDPHDYEATPRDQLAVARADVIVENGGGYDDFMNDLRAASGNHRATVITAVDLPPRVDRGGHDANEHVWYEFATMRSLADRLVEALSRDDPHHAAAFRSNAKRFVTGIDRLEAKVGHIRASAAGSGVAVTEPVPDYLIAEAGLANRTPAAFSEAVEDGTGVPPKVLADTLALFEHHRVRALVENAQTTGPATTRVLAAAHENHIPVVPVTETLPRGDTYLSWMEANVDALARALG